MGVEADVRKLQPVEADVLARWIGIYKAWRGVLHGGRFSQGRTANGVWWLAQQGGRAILGVFTQSAPASMHHAPLRLPSLVSDGIWRLRLLGMAGQERARGDASAPWLEALRHAGVACAATELRHIGLPLPNMNPESALVFSLESQSN
jgi:alpha-galactosidase